MKELAKALVAIACISIIVITGMNHGVNGDLARVAVIAISGIALGADAFTEWIEKKKIEAQIKDKEAK